MDLVDPLRLLAAILVVAGLVALLLLAARRLERLRGGPGRRLAVVESCWLDGRNRLVLVRCDAGEHLLVVGQHGVRPLALPAGGSAGGTGR